MRRKQHQIYLKLLFLLLLSLSTKVFAYKTVGRITLGSFLSTERFKNDDFGSESNDSQLLSGRLFYKISELGDDKWDLTSDIRDKHDFFGKLNKEQLQLDSKNELQTRQMSARWTNPNGPFSATGGRFQIPEAGTVFLDGLMSEYRYNSELRSGFFVGYNPKSIEKSYLEFNENAKQVGTYLTYESKNKGWDQNNFISHGLVQQTFYNQIERTYLFHNWIYQWNYDSRWISYLMLDFVPKTYIQIFNFTYQQKISNSLSTELSFLGIDVVEYRRIQNVLEKLSASPFRETKGQLNYRINPELLSSILLSSGQRDYDNLKREEFALGLDLNNFYGKYFDLRNRIGIRNNFTSKDQYLKAALGYYSRKWESYLDLQYEINKNNDGTTTHPIFLEWGLTSYVLKTLFITGSLQRAADENVTISSAFIKIGYRFGKQEMAPIRDGAPARGSL